MNDDIDHAPACFVEDPETGEVLTVEHTAEYSRVVIAFNQAECQHDSTAPYRVRIANGAVQVRNCCEMCGERVGMALSQREKGWVASLPWHPEEHAASYNHRRNEERRAMLLALARRQYAERGHFTKRYSKYLDSDAWRSKRALVLRRCGGACEGCGIKDATEVHHVTYLHLFDEFLFELLGLCHSCHDRITKERHVELGVGGQRDVE